MQVTREDLNPCTVKLDIVCSQEQIESGFDRALKQYAKQLKVPGFRPGKAPKDVVAKMVDPDDLRGEAADIIVRAALKTALEQEGIALEGRPSVELVSFEREPAEMTFTVKVPLPAKVELMDVTTITAEKPSAEVDEEEVERELEALRRRQGKRETITDRGLQDGDMAVINIQPEGAEEGKSFMIVSGQTFPELDGVLQDLTPESVVTAKLPFPESFQEKDWAGKTMEATVTVRSITSLRLPELDEAFAKSMQFDTMDELRTRVREHIERAKAQNAQEVVNEQILDQIAAGSQVHFADTTWESVLERQLNEVRRDLASKKSSLEEFCEKNGMTVEEYVEAQKKEAKLQVQRAVIVEHIFRQESMEVTQDEAQRHFLQIASENGVKPDGLAQFHKEYGEAIRDEVLFRAMYGKVMEWLNEQVTVTEVAGE